MTTASVTPEIFIPEHFESCTEQAIGAVVLDLIAAGRTHPHDLQFLRSMAAVQQEHGQCGCWVIQLRSVDADLTVARKAQRAGYDKTAVIADLTARRTGLVAARLAQVEASK